MSNLFNLFLYLISMRTFQITHGDETTTQQNPIPVFNETENIENVPPYLENGTVVNLTASHNETVPIYQRFQPDLNIIKDLAAIEVPSKEITWSVATLAPTLKFRNRYTSPAYSIYSYLADYSEKEAARQGCWNKKLAKKNFSKCKTACTNAYQNLCDEGSCPTGFIVEALEYCVVICKENFF